MKQLLILLLCIVSVQAAYFPFFTPKSTPLSCGTGYAVKGYNFYSKAWVCTSVGGGSGLTGNCTSNQYVTGWDENNIYCNETSSGTYNITYVNETNYYNVTYNSTDADTLDGLHANEVFNITIKVDNATYSDNSDTLDSHHWSEVETTKVDNATYSDSSGDCLTLDGLNYYEILPVGTILMFNGTFIDDVTLPGWFICDGTDGTPNLVDKFIRGASTSGATGGANSHNHSVDVGIKLNTTDSESAHTHSIDVPITVNTTVAESSHTHTYTQVPNHVHIVTVSTGTTDGAWGRFDTASSAGTNRDLTSNNPTGGVATGTTNGGSAHSHSYALNPDSFTSGTGSSHSHTFSINPDSVNSGNADNIPEYYALIYVMRVE